jgi:hypothetical protein
MFGNMNISPEINAMQVAFASILRELAGSGRWPDVSLVAGSDLLDDPGGISADFIHPSGYGHTRTGVHHGRILGAAKE